MEFLLEHGAKLELTEENIDLWNTSDEIKDLLNELLTGADSVP